MKTKTKKNIDFCNFVLYKLKNNKRKFCTSLLIIAVGIFLFPHNAYFSDLVNEKIIELTNKERQILALPTLTANQLLTKAAYDKANAIFESGNFQHNLGDRKFSSWIKEAGYSYSYVGENLAIDFLTSEGAVLAWMNSPSHKKNIINPKFSEIGVAVVNGEFKNQNTTVVVQIFGTPPANIAQISSSPKVENNLNSASNNLLTHSLSNNQYLIYSAPLEKINIQGENFQTNNFIITNLFNPSSATLNTIYLSFILFILFFFLTMYFLQIIRIVKLSLQ